MSALIVEVPVGEPVAEAIVGNAVWNLVDIYNGTERSISLFILDEQYAEGSNTFIVEPYGDDGMGGSGPCPNVEFVTINAVDGATTFLVADVQMGASPLGMSGDVGGSEIMTCAYIGGAAMTNIKATDAGEPSAIKFSQNTYELHWFWKLGGLASWLFHWDGGLDGIGISLTFS